MHHPQGRVLIEVDPEQKNHHTFPDGTTIRLERGYDNFNRRYTEQTLATCLSGEAIPAGALVLLHHNALHATFEVRDHVSLSGEQIARGVKVYSIPQDQCYLWKIKGEPWRPCVGYATALRVFQPYQGPLVGIAPTQLKNVLLVTSGDLSGRVCHVLKAADYEIIFRGEAGVEERIIRIRHKDDPDYEREEVIATSEVLTEALHKGELLVGLTPEDAKPYCNLEINLDALEGLVDPCDPLPPSWAQSGLIHYKKPD